MKKTILLSALVASVVSMASTTGSVEAYSKNETTYSTYHQDFLTGLKTTKSTLGVKTEVKVKDSGFSFGAELKGKDLTVFDEHKTQVTPDGTYPTILENVKNNSSVWAKYELPELNGVMSYVKGAFKNKHIFIIMGNHPYQYETITLEADASYKIADKLTVGLNSKTEIDTSKEYEKEIFGDKFTSIHKVYVKGDYSVVKDIDAELELTHDWHSHAKDASKADPDPLAKDNYALRVIFLNAKASYKEIKDFVLTGEIYFKKFLDYSVLSTFPKIPFKNIYDEEYDEEGPNSATQVHSYALTVAYKGFKNTEITFKPFTQHVLYSDHRIHKQTFSTSGFNLGVKYTGIDNLVLSSNNSLRVEDEYIKRFSMNDYSIWIDILLNANAEYTYKATDKLTIKPSLDLLSIINLSKWNHYYLQITPKVAVEYKPVESLTLSGNVAPVVNFEGDQRTFAYERTTVKSNFNIKYTW